MRRSRKLYVSTVVVYASFVLAEGCNSQSGNNNCPTPIQQRLVAKNVGGYLTGGGNLVRLTGHVPRAVRNMTDAGKTAEDASLDILVTLPLRNEDELDQRLGEMYRQGSATFKKFMSASEFHDRYAPTDADVAGVRKFLESEGIQVTDVNAGRNLIHARGTVRAMNHAFRTELHHFSDAAGKRYFAPAYEIQVPNGIRIQSVHGLQNAMQFRRHSLRLSASAISSRGGSGPNGGLAPNDIRSAYRVPSGVDGTGQTLAVFELDGYNVSDVAGYESAFSLPRVPLANVLVDGATGAAGNGAGEVTLDIELMVALAPGASRILVYEGPNTDQGVLDTYARIANDNLAREVSTSWGLSEDKVAPSFVQAESQIFKQMAAQGQSIYAASGDAGAYDNFSTISVDDPASQPYMVGVGGTKLSTNWDGSYSAESVWNTDGNPRDGGGGGGISKLWTQPSYQNGAVSGASHGSTTMRNVPDVALNADPQSGYSIYFQGSWMMFGGTSCASPLWAAFTALVNQERAKNGLGVTGFVNPALYQIGQSNRYDSDFFDVRDGSTNMFYPAVNGYDNASGWGSFNAQGLLQDLANDTVSLPVTGGDPVGGALPGGTTCKAG